MTVRLIALLLAAADAVLAALLGIGIPLAAASAVWLAQGVTGDWSLAFAAAAAVWALSLGGTAQFTVDQAQVVLDLAPLALTLTTVLPAWRSGRRMRQSATAPWLGAAGPIVFALVVAGVITTAAHPLLGIDAARAALLGGLWYALAVALGAAGWQSLAQRLDEALPGWGLDGVRAVLRGAGIMLAGLVAAAAALLAAALVASLWRVLSLYQSLLLDPVGAVVIGLGQLALLPNAVLWSISWLLGPGFALGEGSSIAPGGTVVGPLPLLPLLGALPEDPPVLAPAVLVIPVALGLLAGVAVRRAPGGASWAAGWRRVAVPLAAAAVSAAVLAALTVASGGAIGPDRLQVTGPDAGAVALTSFAALGVGALVAAYLPLELVPAPPGPRPALARSVEEAGEDGAPGADEAAFGSSERARDDADDGSSPDDDADESVEAVPGRWTPASRGSAARPAARGRRPRARAYPAAGGDDATEPAVGDDSALPSSARRGRSADAAATAPIPLPRGAGAARTPQPRTAVDDDEPDIYAGIDPLADR